LFQHALGALRIGVGRIGTYHDVVQRVIFSGGYQDRKVLPLEQDYEPFGVLALAEG
jgi:hypothetical protein